MTVALVTGATSGIGRATALALAAEGWTVVATGRDDQRGAELEAELDGKGRFEPADLRDPDVPAQLVESAVAGDEELGLLVNNAAEHFLGTIDELDDDRYARLMSLNVDAAVRLSREAVRRMKRAGGGVVVNVSSEAGVYAIPNQLAYNVSKAALIMLTRSVATDHAADGIRAVSVCPGTTLTPLVERAIESAGDPDSHRKRLASSRPLGRLGEPHEVAAAIVFAASEKASFITGTELMVDGGFSAT